MVLVLGVDALKILLIEALDHIATAFLSTLLAPSPCRCDQKNGGENGDGDVVVHLEKVYTEI